MTHNNYLVVRSLSSLLGELILLALASTKLLLAPLATPTKALTKAVGTFAACAIYLLGHLSTGQLGFFFSPDGLLLHWSGGGRKPLLPLIHHRRTSSRLLSSSLDRVAVFGFTAVGPPYELVSFLRSPFAFCPCPYFARSGHTVARLAGTRSQRDWQLAH